MSVEVLHCGNTDFYDLDLDPMTFIYELDRIPADQNFAFFVKLQTDICDGSMLTSLGWW